MKSNKKYYTLGYLLYIIIILSAVFVPSINDLLVSGLQLAPFITILEIVVLFYPLLIMLYINFNNSDDKNSYKNLSYQSKIFASVAISLGLLGTFLGLISMVSSIAKSIQGTGDISVRIEAMLATISTALNAMSYAFITSVLGVIISVIIIVSLNFWKFYFNLENSYEIKSESTEAIEKLNIRLESIEKLNVGLTDKLIAIGTDKTILSELISTTNAIAKIQESTNENVNNLFNVQRDLSTQLSSFLTVAQDSQNIVAKTLSDLKSSIDSQLSSLNSIFNELSLLKSEIVNVKSNTDYLPSVDNLLKDVKSNTDVINNLEYSLNKISDEIINLKVDVDYSKDLTDIANGMEALNKNIVILYNDTISLSKGRNDLLNSQTHALLEQNASVNKLLETQAKNKEKVSEAIKNVLEVLG